ncbi:MAG: MBL fold metallo-hydrolase [Candidatus Aminicenantes bacterium]|nr:MBL fold metallo-hydrolase [Candidatus Aminicenantes bacterium]
MEIEFWGARGTAPVSSPETVRYGGATSCASMRKTEDEILIIDAGTGIRALGLSLIRDRKGPIRVHLLLTHFHLDHIMGFPFFSPLLVRDVELFIYAPVPVVETKYYLGGLMSGRYFPIPLTKMPAAKVFKQIHGDPLPVAGFQVSACPLRHPQGSVAYRIEDGLWKVVFATDTEHPEYGIDRQLRDFCREADFLVYDATYAPEEYAIGKKGWGHSHWRAGVALAHEAGAKRLVLSHHNPDHSDARIDALLVAAKDSFPMVDAARAGWKRTI